MKFIIRHILLIAVLGTFAAGCSHSAPAEQLADAQTLLDNGEVDEAQHLCDNLLARTDSAEIGPRAYGQLSMAYMHLADVADPDDNIANAAVCFRRAYNLNADSAEVYYTSLVGDDAMRYTMLATIVDSQRHPFNEASIEPDSLIGAMLDTLNANLEKK